MAKPAFYIKQLVVSCPNVPPAVIDFSEGLNIITGASNTGKSLIIDCLDYAFGYKKQGKNNHYRMDTLLGYGYDFHGDRHQCCGYAIGRNHNTQE